MSPPGSVLNVALIGCGAVAEHYYAPALAALGGPENLRVTALVDPAPSRLLRLKELLRGAATYRDIDELDTNSISLAIVASPPRFHFEHTVILLERGVHVLCEKPLATNLTEAKRMVAAAQSANRLLCAGYFRRFFATSEFVHDLLRTRALGAPKRFTWSEGGAFTWPAATSSFFRKSQSTGGVMADSGSHIIDLLVHWFGAPLSFHYEDDAMGGLEANARLSLVFPHEVSGNIRLSREAPILNHVELHFEKGTVSFAGATARNLTLTLNDCATSLSGELRSVTNLPARSYEQAFMAQISDLTQAIRHGTSPRVPARDVLIGMDLITHCYNSRKLMPQPWLTAEEITAAQSFVTATTSL